MKYIYDILLNFKKDNYDFYDWNSNDNIIHVKKIPIYRISSKVLYNIYNNSIRLNKCFLNSIKGKTRVYSDHTDCTYKYSCLLTDGYHIYAFLFDKNGIKKFTSALLIDEYSELCRTLKRVNKIDFNYSIISKINDRLFMTRYEHVCINKIKKVINAFDSNEIKYLYYDFYGRKGVRVKSMKQKLLSNLENDLINRVNEYIKIKNKA